MYQPPPPSSVGLGIGTRKSFGKFRVYIIWGCFYSYITRGRIDVLKKKIVHIFFLYSYILLCFTSDAHILVFVSLFRLLRISFLHKSFNENIAISVVILKRKGFKTHTILSLLRFSHLSRGFDLLFNKLETPFDKDIVFLVWLN